MEMGNYVFGNSRGEYEVNRNWQEAFCNFLRECGFEGYGFVEHERLAPFKVTIQGTEEEDGATQFENDIFVVLPYYWGDDDEIKKRPNFVYKPTGFEMNWYKYPLRDSYMNQPISFGELEEMMEHCFQSVSHDPKKIQDELDRIEKQIKMHEKSIRKLEKKKERLING